MSNTDSLVDFGFDPTFSCYRVTKSVRSFGLYVQSLKPYTKLLAVVLSVALIGSTLAFGGVAAVNQTSDGDQQQTAYLKVVHASPDAPPVDVMVKNETVLSDVPFGAVSDYLALEAGTYNVTIAAAGDSETVVFDGEVTLEPRSVTTLAASGEISEGAETTFELVAYEDTAPAPADNESALRVIHLSPLMHRPSTLRLLAGVSYSPTT